MRRDQLLKLNPRTPSPRPPQRERTGERTNERGGMSEETRARMAGMFMEDEELAGDYTDTISKMEAALAKAEGRDVEEDLDEATKAKLDAEKLDDGWDD